MAVKVDNFARAETDRMFAAIQAQAGGVNQWLHYRSPTPVDQQTVIRMNRDTSSPTIAAPTASTASPPPLTMMGRSPSTSAAAATGGPTVCRSWAAGTTSSASTAPAPKPSPAAGPSPPPCPPASDTITPRITVATGRSRCKSPGWAQIRKPSRISSRRLVALIQRGHGDARSFLPRFRLSSSRPGPGEWWLPFRGSLLCYSPD